jgi:hypothetical protein
MACSRKQVFETVIVEYQLREYDGDLIARLVASMELSDVTKCELRWCQGAIESELFEEDVVPLRSQTTL